MSRRRRLGVALAAAGVAGLALLGGCGGSGGGDGGASAPEPTLRTGDGSVPVSLLQGAAAGLCTARAQAGADVKAAATTFYDRSHDALHDLARALDASDRAASARVLEGKQRVESALERGAPGPDVAAELGSLAEVTRQALARLGVDAAPCA